MKIKAVWNVLFYYKKVKKEISAKNRFLSYCEKHKAYWNRHKDIYDYVKKYGLAMYPYEWFSEMKDTAYKISYSGTGKMKYVLYKGKRLYYPACISDHEINGSLNFYEKEQNPKSPHCYMPDDDRGICEGSVLVECGASEGTFALSVIDKCSKIYIFEGDAKYTEGLKKTFEDYSDKVVIINKYVDSYVHTGYTTIDEIVKEPVNFIKMDIEGYELKALFGARKTIRRSSSMRMSICAYHNAEDYMVIPAYLKSLGCRTSLSSGCLFRSDETLWDSKIPDLRHGMIFAKKGEEKKHENTQREDGTKSGSL